MLRWLPLGTSSSIQAMIGATDLPIEMYTIFVVSQRFSEEREPILDVQFDTRLAH